MRAAFATALATLVTAAPAAAEPVFVLTGKGWGHGLGMSQYGAYGYAQNGWGDHAILTHYYAGTAITAGFPNDTVRVLVASARPSLSIGSAASFTFAGETLAAGTYTVAPVGGQVRVSGNGTTETAASPATFAPGAASLSLGGTLYRRDLLVSASGSSSVSAVNELPRQLYLQGVVPREMPAGWAAEALEAQATAARTYSLAGGGHCAWLGNPVLCPDTRDQVYGGRSAETAATNDAVVATAGEVITFGGTPISANFFSTSGGATATKAEEWGPPAVPYLVSVDDPFDTISPHHAWGPLDAEVDCAGTSPDCRFTAAQAKAALGLAKRPVDLRVTARNGSGRVATLAATDSTGTTAFTGADSRTKLGLRSTWFFVGVLSIDADASTVTYGGTVHLSGLARRGGTAGWGEAVLERRKLGADAWTQVGGALPDGEWTRSRAPTITTDFRVVSGNGATAPRRVYVRTRVALRTPTATRLSGFVRPARAGIAVRLFRRNAAGTWKLAATAATNASGDFAFALGRGGTYRVRADAGTGYAEGSATVAIPAAARPAL
jgi:stage II sporulation protein D